MNINRINSIYQTYNKSKIKNVNKAAATSNAKDVADISSIGKDFQTAFRAAMSADDVREDLVNDIKDKMDKGEYEMDTDALVDKIIGKKK